MVVRRYCVDSPHVRVRRCLGPPVAQYLWYGTYGTVHTHAHTTYIHTYLQSKRRSAPLPTLQFPALYFVHAIRDVHRRTVRVQYAAWAVIRARTDPM